MSGDSDYSASQSPPSPYSSAASPSSAYKATDPAADGYGPYSSPQTDPTKSSSPAAISQSFGNGVNMQPSYQANGNVDLGWDLLKPIKAIKTVRLEIEAFAVNAAVRWISEAAARGYTIIATYHSFDAINNKPASDDPKHMQAAIQFWRGNYQKLSAGGSFIINLMNEWGHNSIDAKKYADQYNQAITSVRSFYNGPIIIDLPGSGQLAKVAADAVSGAGGATPIQDQNVILSAHVYPTTWNGKGPMTPADLDILAATGRRCMIGEFGDDNTNGKTDWRAIVDYAKSLSWPVLAWAWDGDGTIMNIMRPEFQPFVSGKPFASYEINSQYADIVLPYIA
jgi:mannan endo-1,4-beta-mannosidase